MFRKIILWVIATIGVLVVGLVVLTIYVTRQTPEVAEMFKAVTGGHPDGYRECVGSWTATPDGQDFDVAAEENCRKAAQAGDPLAQFIMGQIVQRRAKDTQTLAEAANWFELSSKQNFYEAMYSLGLMYYKGEGVNLDYEKAKDLFLPAAKRKNAGAQLMLATMYAHGQGLSQDNIQAVAWLTIALDQGRLRSKDTSGVKQFRERLATTLTPEQQAQAKDLASTY